MAETEERKPKWAWSSVDDPDPYYPKCDRCDAFARWSVARMEDGTPFGDESWIIRWFACGRHIGKVLTEEEWWLDAVQIYDLTYEAERP